MESENNFQQFGEKSQEGDKILQQAEESVLGRNERYVARRLADAALKSLGYNSKRDESQSGPNLANDNPGKPTIISEATKTTETRIQDTSGARPRRKIKISELRKKEKLFPDAVEQGPETNELSQAELTMQEFIRKSLRDAGKKYHEYERELSINEVSYFAENNYDSNIALDREAREIRLKEQELSKSSPEGYYIVYGNELRRHIAESNSNHLVITPSVEERLMKVKKNMVIGRPTFIHGHLGGGKTELAITAARQTAIERAAYERAADQYFDYVDANPNLTEDERADFLASTYRKNIAHFEKALQDGDPEAQKAFTPLIISGSKDLTTQDLFTDKTLKLTKFNDKTILGHKKDLDAVFDEWKAENPEDAKDPQKSQDAANKILEIFKLKNQAFGTEVEIIEQAIYRGIKEGRPVIIDEANAIPTAILISLNDVLQRRPGDNCYIPGVGATEIKPGFSITMTGNLSSNIIDYRGTEKLNPALKSRLDVFEYGYLPMSESDHSYKDQDHPEDNELFQAIVASLADRQGNLRLPEIDKSLEKIFSLCQLAHETQRIFSGKWRESDFNHKTPSGDDIEPRLEDSVLSIRNIKQIINDAWERNRNGDLDKALWDGFIQGITNPDDQNLILILAKQHGFFQESDGWNVQIKERGASLTDFPEIHPGKYEYQPKDFEVYSYRKVVEALYGPAPKRELYPDLKLDELASLGDDEFSEEDIPGYETKKKEILEAISALEVLGEQCGCNTNNNSSAFGGQ